MMLTLHTLENEYDDGSAYHQFVQRGRQGVLESVSLCGEPQTLGDFLRSEMCDLPDVEDVPRAHALFVRTLEAGRIADLLGFACKFMLKSSEFASDARDTRFGEWTFDSMVLEEPSLRELQEDVWASDPDHPKQDWKDEVENDETHLGYWEWVESQREQQADAPAGARRVRTSDGYTFTEQPDGTWTDGDMAYGSYAEMARALEGDLMFI